MSINNVTANELYEANKWSAPTVGALIAITIIHAVPPVLSLITAVALAIMAWQAFRKKNVREFFRNASEEKHIKPRVPAHHLITCLGCLAAFGFFAVSALAGIIAADPVFFAAFPILSFFQYRVFKKSLASLVMKQNS